MYGVRAGLAGWQGSVNQTFNEASQIRRRHRCRRRRCRHRTFARDKDSMSIKTTTGRQRTHTHNHVQQVGNRTHKHEHTHTHVVVVATADMSDKGATRSSKHPHTPSDSHFYLEVPPPTPHHCTHTPRAPRHLNEHQVVENVSGNARTASMYCADWRA